MLNGMAYQHNHLNQKEEKMLNRKIVIPVLVVVLVCLVCVINVNAAEAEKVNINTASAEQLTQLKGIGPNHAAKIVEFREKNGPFKTPEDLAQVSGIGQKTVENNKDLILVAEPQ
jgi:competence protein ComEA